MTHLSRILHAWTQFWAPQDRRLTEVVICDDGSTSEHHYLTDDELAIIRRTRPRLSNSHLIFGRPFDIDEKDFEA